jgi:RHS repeat-associated protein
LRQLEDQERGETSVSYDAIGHLLQRLQAHSTDESFSYDANGNVLSATRTFTISRRQRAAEGVIARSDVREIALDNQTQNSGATHYEYDGDGRLIRKVVSATGPDPGVWTYGWNPFGFLMDVTRPDGARFSYSYDAFGRRTRKQGPGVDVFYIWDGNAVLHEQQGNGKDVTTWTFFPHNFEPIAKKEGGDSYFVIPDHLGTPQELIDQHGRITWRISLSAWGELESLNDSDTSCEIRFQGQWFDPETRLHYNNGRYYDPALGAFISMDPVPFFGGLNGYQYAPNPIQWIDPLGLVADYQPVDQFGRPTGASADLTPADRNTGTPTSSATQDPPGWVGGLHPDHQQRSHLIADSLGGSGTDPRNIIALTDGSNNPGMARCEAKIRDHLDSDPNSRVLMHVTVHYDNNDPNSMPKSVHIYALDKNGNVIVDEHIDNGKRQKRGCCP